MTDRSVPLSDRVYVELVRSLYVNPTPSLIMSAAFLLSFGLILAEGGRDPFFIATGIAGLAATVIRLSITYGLRNRALVAPLDRAQARKIELAYGIPFIAFAVCLGAFAARSFMMPSIEAHMITICLVIGYGAGTATGAGLRPMIAVPSILIAIVPATIVGALRADPTYIGTSVIAWGLVAGGIQTVLGRCAAVQSEIGKRLTFGSLARSDGLTALPNRLALREYFEENVTLISAKAMVAVHYLDLNGFKPVNDQYGHSVGDALLGAVGERLTNAIRNGDIVARLGGDEFAIVQFGLRREEEAQLLAQRILSSLGQPYRIDDHLVSVTASIGSITSSDRAIDLDSLLAKADSKLYEAKRKYAGGPRVAA